MAYRSAYADSFGKIDRLPERANRVTARRKHATIAEVARLAGVAKSTASLAFSAPERVNSQTLKRITRAAKETGYAPNIAAQSLKTGRNNLLGLVVSDLRNPHNGIFLAEVQANAIERGHLVIAGMSEDDTQREQLLLNRFKSLRVRGIVLSPTGSGEAYAHRINDVGARIIAYDHKIDALDCDHVGLDNRLATTLLTRHLIKLGHRRIAHITGRRGLWSAEQRLAGYLNTLAEASIDCDQTLIAAGDYDQDTSYQAAMSLLGAPQPPTAIVTANNDTAIGALKAIRALALDCPGDVSLVSVDEIPYGDLISPRVTAVAQPVKALAKIATDWLFDRLDMDSTDETMPPREVMLAPELRIGKSTRPV